MSSGHYIRSSFGKKFEPAGEGFIYRSTSSAPGIPVTADEHREMVADLDCRIRCFGVLASGWILAAAVLFPLVVVLFFFKVYDLVWLAVLFCALMLATVPLTRLHRATLKRIAGRPAVDGGSSWIETMLRDVAVQPWRSTIIFALAPLAYLRHLGDPHQDSLTTIVFASMAVLSVVAGGVALSIKIWLAFRRKLRT